MDAIGSESICTFDALGEHAVPIAQLMSPSAFYYSLRGLYSCDGFITGHYLKVSTINRMDTSVIAIVIGLLIAIIALLAYIVSQQSTPVTVVQEPAPVFYNDSYMLGRPYWPNSYWNWYDPGFGPRGNRGWFDHPHIPHPKPPVGGHAVPHTPSASDYSLSPPPHTPPAPAPSPAPAPAPAPSPAPAPTP